ncbi:uncharacterized protein BX663DRAFT_486716 [Cokeromyces recurvatus]|uniref:uncharacterized protein n=1 Tax=Cokeromyces recurvatus TaxID=90255 RepID=UPI00221EDE63|nr:uncharacterized protein BX663DRAFT_486716 [Cokeromyces recurvatus]KAI7902405.1 hypothetical protein BX663DRAFT_486716 [Cokeromyces recurvatus]
MSHHLQILAYYKSKSQFKVEPLLSILGNFKGLWSVYLAKVNLDMLSSRTNGISILNEIPDYLTIAIFVICQGTKNDETVCTPPSFGYRYDSTGILQMLEEQLSPELQTDITGLQGGIFIPSVVFIFILLCAYFIHLFTINRVKYQYSWFRKLILPLISLITLLLCIATFVVQLVIYHIVKNKINTAKDELYGGLLNLVLRITVSAGRSIWMTLASSILLFIVTILLCFSLCFLSRQKRMRKTYENDQQMDTRAY